MSKFFRCFSVVLLLGLTLFFTSCGDSKKVSATLNITEMRTSIKATVNLLDPDGVLASDSSSKVYGQIYLRDKLDEDCIDDVTFGTTIEKDVERTFDSLEKETEYTIVIYATYNNRTHTLVKENCSTTNKGSEEDPAPISTLEELLKISKDNEGYFKLTEDIDCNGAELSPLFDSSNTFKGSFDGDNHTIKNFKFTKSTNSGTKYQGLFGYNMGVIKNLKIDGVSLESSRSGETYVSALAGYNGGTIENVEMKNITLSVETVSTGSQLLYVGALVGLNAAKSVIDGCSADVKITAKTKLKARIGGLIGENQQAKLEISPVVKNSNATSNIDVVQTTTSATGYSIESYVGGFIGLNGSKILDSYASSTIKFASSKTTTSYKAYFIKIGGFAGASLGVAELNGVAATGTLDVSSSDIDDAFVGGVVGYVEGFGASLSVSKLKNVIFVSTNSEIKVSLNTSAKQAFAGLVYGESKSNSITNAITNASLDINVASGTPTITSSSVSTDYSSFSDSVKAFINKCLE